MPLNVPALIGKKTAHTYKVGASMYGGPTDPTSGTHGYRGDNLVGTHAFAELNMGTALGNLPHGTQLMIAYKGKTVTGTKLDIGAGGGPAPGGVARRIDLWYQTAQALGFNGLDVVEIMRPDGSPITGLGAGSNTPIKPGVGSPIGAANAAASAVASPLADVAKVFAFLFSKQFLYIVGGGALMLVALILIVHTMGGGGQGGRRMPIPVPV